MQQAERYGEEWHHVSGTVASHANVLLTRHTIFPNVRGAGTRDEPLRTPAVLSKEHILRVNNATRLTLEIHYFSRVHTTFIFSLTK